MKIKEPVFEKNHPHPFDYKELTFKDFIRIQNAAQEVADKIGYPVYLVGSALRKHTPRDIDIAIIIPSDIYVEKYSEGPYEILDVEIDYGAFIANAFYAEFENIKALNKFVFKDYVIDLKICPDNWFTDKEKVVLAAPSNKGDK